MPKFKLFKCEGRVRQLQKKKKAWTYKYKRVKKCFRKPYS